jgi:hypothetical protein
MTVRETAAMRMSGSLAEGMLTVMLTVTATALVTVRVTAARSAAAATMMAAAAAVTTAETATAMSSTGDVPHSRVHLHVEYAYMLCS